MPSTAREEDCAALLELNEHIRAATRLYDRASPIPRKIWFYWNDGLENAPDVVKRSAETWQIMNPDHELVVLDTTNLTGVLGLDFEALCSRSTVVLSEAGKSDVLRLCLLYVFGGTWVDATTFCLNPLSEWLYGEMNETGFFCFRQRNKELDRILVSWFLSARQALPFVGSWLSMSLDYLFAKRAAPLRVVKARDVDKVKRTRDGMTGFPFLTAAEQQGLAPCFWAFYLFNENIKQNAEAWEDIQSAKGNQGNHSQQDEGPLPFLTADVSKQTYKGNYAKSNTYRGRLSALFSNGTPSRENLEKAHRALDDRDGWRAWYPNAQINENGRYFFIHIPKCGGTSVDNSNAFTGPHPPNGHAQYGDFRSVLGSRFELFKCFAFIRNPWDRLISAFHYLSSGGSNSRDLRLYRLHLSGFNGDPARFLDAFCETPGRFKTILHMRPAVTFFDPRRCEIPFYVQKIEDAGDLSGLNIFLGLERLDLPRMRIGGGPSRDATVFTEETFTKVAEVYA